jgi:hypothetical protein
LKAGVIGADRFFGQVNFGFAFLGYIAFRLVVILFAAIGLYYAVMWTPVTNIGGGRPADPNAAIITLIWNIDAVRLVAGVVFAVLIALALKGMWLLLVALLDRKRPLEGENAHGPARTATEQESTEHERGGARLPIHDQRFS